MDTTRRTCIIVAVSAALLAPRPSLAGDKDFVIYLPGYGASASQAKPYMDKFAALIEKRMKWTAGTARIEFLDDAKAVAACIEKQKPAYGLMLPSYYLDLACRKVQVTPLTALVSLSTGSSSSVLAPLIPLPPRRCAR